MSFKINTKFLVTAAIIGAAHWAIKEFKVTLPLTGVPLYIGIAVVTYVLYEYVAPMLDF